VSLSRKVRADIAPEYKSIGDFYEDLAKGKLQWSSESPSAIHSISPPGLKHLHDKDFTNNTDNQFSGFDFFNDQMVVISDKASALKAVGTIIEQGEGNVVVPDSHYAAFAKLYLNREGWTLLNLPKNPQTLDYFGKDRTGFLQLVGCLCRLVLFP
jgi:Ferritin-like